MSHEPATEEGRLSRSTPTQASSRRALDASHGSSIGATVLALATPVGFASVWMLRGASESYAQMTVAIVLGLLAGWLAMVGVSWIRSGLKYGRARLWLTTAAPLTLGEVLEGEICIPRGIGHTTDVRLVLELTRRPSHSSRRTPERERVIESRSLLRPGPDGARAPVRIDLPANAMPSSAVGEAPVREWRLFVEADPHEGPPLRTSFALTLVPRGSSRPA